MEVKATATPAPPHAEALARWLALAGPRARGVLACRIDTNVIVSATLIRGGNEDRILRAWHRGAFELVLSPPILKEIARALSYEKLRRARRTSSVLTGCTGPDTLGP